MNAKLLIYLAAATMLLASCQKEAGVRVTNKISNVSISNIYLGKNLLITSGSLLPGERTDRIVKAMEGEDGFPFKSHLEFHMSNGGNTVFLKTLEIFELREGGLLNVELTNETEVYNPMTGTAMAIGRQ